MNPRRYLPSRRQPTHAATTQRVPLPRPDLDSDPLDDWPPKRADCEETPADWRPAPPRRLQIIPWPRENGSGQQPRAGGSAATRPQPRLTPGTRPAEGGRVPEPGGYAASVAPHPPATPWQPPPIDQPQPSAFDQLQLPASDQLQLPASEQLQLPAVDRPGQPQAIEHPSPARALGPPQQLRAIIADEIRIPILWCEFGECIECYTDAEALGERDLRARAYTAGWRYDALSRLACPTCVQCDASFWATRPPVLFDRDRYGRPR